MDDFQYILLSNEIDTFKTLKAKDVCIRECFDKLTKGSGYFTMYSLKPENLYDVANLYKAITKVLLTYDEGRLPDKILKGINITKEYLIKTLLNANVSREKFDNTFQFKSELATPKLTTLQTTTLITMYGDTAPRIPIEVSMSTSYKFTHLIEDEHDDVAATISHTMRLETIKQTLPDETNFVMLEEMLDKAYSAIPKLPDNTTNFIVDAMQSLLDAARTVRDRLV